MAGCAYDYVYILLDKRKDGRWERIYYQRKGNGNGKK